MKELITLTTIKTAATRLTAHTHLTPLLTSTTLSTLLGPCPSTTTPRTLLIKAENLQRTGSFKLRGATNAITKLLESDPVGARQKGVVVHSSGNHGQAVALAAKRAGVPCTVVMPRDSPGVKLAAVEGYGATIVLCDRALTSREQTTQEIVDRTGATFIHPSNHPDVIAGQGTVVLEMLHQAAEMGCPLDTVIVPVGGGGLLSGCLVAGKSLLPNLRIVAAEPLLADDCARSVRANEFIPAGPPKSICDGLMSSMGTLTWPIIRDHVDEVRTVDEASIVKAMRVVWERMKMVVEPSAAVGVAVALFDEGFKAREGMRNVGVVVTGGNVDLDCLPWGSMK
ncbi:pyridoxal-5'-phosphate-dependent enzyme, beta subunit [Fimicolochytrium jonesii]|uniref:pyridoxal-5'-phosphate-dependent enzyme, beta subunit n=1 Tax=Fimicolochytrium jonesii TaxID=1396493 RepID=UPI0022FDFA00|nr:pyridoxal-5'-phosphate-dependent enzyme, beta subunit [Fimicolochytrium jonesii]KAI8823101.1 pyridoxal-5'-phosphate-dependent enzyme, beta subunit [Fimicolochytrium jonesii]